MKALELNSIMLTCLSWRIITVNLLTHRHVITRVWAVMYPCTFKFNVWHLNTWLSDRNIHKHFSLKTLIHKNITHKTMLYMICMTGSIGASVPHDADNWCLTMYPTTLQLYCCWCMIYTTCSMFCAWPVYFSLLCHAEIMQLLNHVLLKLNKSNILSNHLKSFKT